LREGSQQTVPEAFTGIIVDQIVAQFVASRIERSNPPIETKLQQGPQLRLERR